ncbi:MAG: D-alanyl-D-alanine carboxypeptidase [Clostridium sp.]|jgi:D-alanyl-D-alanine carboxypeptidase (penicillin-binding protein 5/6)|nr:D-alanyl-D-alanine carboxypeptidase [Clostridium sp.]
MRKRILIGFAAIFLLCLLPVTAFGEWSSSLLKDSGITLHSPIYLLANADDGEVIFSKGADTRSAPASLTKIATAAVVLEERADLSERVTVTQADLDALYGTDSSTAGLSSGEERTIKELLACLLLPSGNDAAMTLARVVGGSVTAFVEKMNRFAQTLGCGNTQFVNPHGLDEPGQYSSAADMLKMVRKAMEYPVFAELVAKREYELPAVGGFPARTIKNTNELMNPGIPDYYSPYAIGIKTGHTEESGRCVIGYASHNGYSYYAIVMRGTIKNLDDDAIGENTAFVDAKSMFAWAFENLRLVKVATPLNVITELPLLYGKEGDRMPLSPAEDIYLLLPSSVAANGLLIVPDEESLPEELEAPVEQGKAMGGAKVYYANQEVGEFALVTQSSAQRSAFLYTIKLLGDVFKSLPFRLIAVVILLLLAGYIVLHFRKRRKKRNPRPMRVGPEGRTRN